MSDTTYNGWTNRETWLAALWMDNDRGLYLSVREMVQQGDDPDDMGERIAAYMAEIAEAICPGVIEGGSFVSDLFGTAWSAVNWGEIAHGYLAEIEHDETEGDSE